MEPQNFLGLGGLTDLGARSGMDMRPTLLRVLTDLYVHRLSHTPDEERHYTELALRMLEVVDVPTRIAAAKRFARYPSPPLRVLQWLARDLPDVAAELRSHPLLQPPAPSAAAQQNTRPTPIAEHAAPGDDEQRADRSAAIDSTTAQKLNDLFFAANADERRLILLSLDVVAPVPAARRPRGARSVRRRAPRSGGPLRQARRLRASARPRAVDSARPGTSYRGR